jgi:D-3-phosphoglycerate dehydrogenase / 2-oxoglutarate reductase
MMTTRRWRVLSEPLHPPFDRSRAAELPVLAATDADLVTADSIAEWLDVAPTADAVLHWQVPIGPQEIDRLEQCRVIAHYGVGVDRIAIQSAAAAGIYVTNVPRYGVAEVADHAMTLLLASARKLRALERTLRTGGWGVNESRPIYRLHGRTLGIIGLGNIGSAVAVRAAGFGLRILAHDPYLPQARFVSVGAEPADLATVLADSDFLSLHVPLTDETRGLIGAREFGQMKRGVFVINTSRGPVLDEGALLDALEAGIVAGAGLDVFHEEPLPADSPLLRDERVIVTPHAAFFSEESIIDMQVGASEQVAAVFAGRRPPYAALLPGLDWAIADRRWNSGASDR